MSNLYFHLRDQRNLISFDDNCRGLHSDITQLSKLMSECTKDIIIPISVSVNEYKALKDEISKPGDMNRPELWNAYTSKSHTNYEQQLTNMFVSFRDNGLTYEDLMSKCGNSFDVDVVNNIMAFFSQFKSKQKPQDRPKSNTITDLQVYQLISNRDVNCVVGATNFCSKIKYGDIRMCIKVLPEDRIKTIQSFNHERGHCLLEQQLNTQYANLMVSLSMHEAHAFIKQFYHIDDNKKQFQYDITPFASSRRVMNTPHFYNQHIAVRYKFEIEMLKDPYQSAQTLLTKISDNILGYSTSIFEDIHWSQAVVGYFPAYSVGHVIAAQLYEHIDNDYSCASLLHDLSELQYIEKISGKPLSTDSFEKLYR